MPRAFDGRDLIIEIGHVRAALGVIEAAQTIAGQQARCDRVNGLGTTAASFAGATTRSSSNGVPLQTVITARASR